MVFSSVIFVFLFLPAVIFLYYMCPGRFLFGRNVILLAFSLAFYFYGEPKYILVMLFSIIINYIFCLLIHREHGKGKNGKTFLVLSIIVNLSILCYFKYLMFAVETINGIFNAGIQLPEIILPVGVSFYTFQVMSYVFDVYNKSVPAEKNIINVALYVSMFPQLIAGPIVLYEDVALALKSRRSTFEGFSQGVERFIYGFAKKIIIANSMAVIATDTFSSSPDVLSGNVAWIGVIAYSFQIFFDFSGYSDMAIGLGKIFGFSFLENFNFPYISRSITEFWRRWHISLGSWFRDYVYIPLGGNRVGAARHILSISVVWFLTGLWHGASWNFIVWGLYFAVILIIEKHFLLKILSKAWRPVSHFYAIILIIIGWVIFRSDDLAYAIKYIARMFDIPSIFAPSGQAFYYISAFKAEWLAAILFSLPVGGFISKVTGTKMKAVFYILKIVYLFAIFYLSVLYLINSTFNPFIYFRF